MNNFISSESYVVFELAGKTCAVNSLSVLSVDMVEHVTAVPNGKLVLVARAPMNDHANAL